MVVKGISIKSRKAKARTLQNKVAEDLRDNFCVPNDTENFIGHIRESEVKPAIMGESGRDIKLTPNAERYIPFDIECKNCESWSIPTWWKQTVTNTNKGRVPLLVIKKNHHEELAVLRWSDLLKLLGSDK